MRPVVVVGDLVTDVVAALAEPPRTGSDAAATIRQTGGGGAGNTACWLAFLGVPVTVVAVVGADDAGRARVAELTAAGIRCAVRAAPGAPTGTVVVLSTPDERTMITDRGANALLSAADVDPALVGAGHLHLSGYPLFDERSAPAGRYALAAARRAGCTTSVDAGSAGPLRRLGATTFLDWIRGTDLLLANADEAAVLGEQARAAARYVVVKYGAAGAGWTSADGTRITRPAEPVAAVDPTGAGDAFAAGLLAAWLNGADPAAALAAGAALGARAVGQFGGRPAVSRPGR